MARRKRLRKVVAPPGFQGFKPYGHRQWKKEHIDLFYEEYEALKLADYDFMTHEQACKIMGISRPTFARIYESARRKIARALVETREIQSVYGNVYMDKSWFTCDDCHSRFNMPSEEQEHLCPLCGSKNIHPLR